MKSLNNSIQTCYIFAAIVFGLSIAVGVATHEGHPILFFMGGLFLLMVYTPERIKSHNERVQRLIEYVTTTDTSESVHKINVLALEQETQRSIFKIALFG